MKKLSQLLQSLTEFRKHHSFAFDQLLSKMTPELGSSLVLGVTADSREVQSGFIFVAMAGGVHDGHQFIQQAVSQGAILIVGESDLHDSIAVPYFKVSGSPGIRSFLAELAAAFYDFPSESMCLVGVTGTSGKTTTVYLIESVLLAAGHQVGVIGTINFRFGTKTFPSTHTTPGAVELQRLLYQMKVEGCTAVVMEVSSHALKQERVSAIAFDSVVFTNLSPEHLDFHLDMEDYFQSKRILFTEVCQFSVLKGKKPIGVVNGDDEYGRRLALELKTLPAKEFYYDSNLQVSLEGIRGQLEQTLIQSPLIGSFNCSNISAAIAVGQSLGISSDRICRGISQLPGVPGRLERVKNSNGIHVWVDYAHKPDALEKVLRALRSVSEGHRLITVFGCGGDRDRKKRPMMGHIAVNCSDHVYITSDNPRTESPAHIIQEILVGTQGFQNFTVEVDRRKAIQDALGSARAGDLVLIAGKGHEDYQIIGKEKFHFDDREVANEVLKKLLC